MTKHVIFLVFGLVVVFTGLYANQEVMGLRGSEHGTITAYMEEFASESSKEKG
jgi:hypothetical protein